MHTFRLNSDPGYAVRDCDGERKKRRRRRRRNVYSKQTQEEEEAKKGLTHSKRAVVLDLR